MLGKTMHEIPQIGLGGRHNRHMASKTKHLLAGAMGIASWKARATLREYEDASNLTGAVLKMKNSVVASGKPVAWSLNEVGVTDTVMTALWRHAGENAVYAVTSAAEKAVFGGDLAIVDRAKTIRVYQAKLVKEIDFAANKYVLKSALTQKHLGHLNTASFVWDGDTYEKHGYLALYQRELQVIRGNWTPCRSDWWEQTAMSVNAPRLGGVYYWDMMEGKQNSPARSASARGIMAVRAPAQGVSKLPVSRLPIDSSWPWEYNVANVWSGPTGPDPKPDHADSFEIPKPLVESGNQLSSQEREAFVSALFEDIHGDTPGTLTVVFL
ncbi:hypothetical protein StoSoilB3_12330 [Arthrobacter sp. StoSoilB3]|nr:hypothetical protein StoSoilB3_12330 [Arthrobacter sp. StoSoilB3]